MTGHGPRTPPRRKSSTPKRDATADARAGGGGGVAIVWFRQELRLADNEALLAAVADGDAVLPVFVLDEAAAGDWAPGAAARWWLHGSLEALERDLAAHGGSRLILRRGDTAEILAELARGSGATRVHCGAAYEPWARDLQDRVAARLRRDNRELRRHRTATLFDLDEILTRTGGHYGVYAPFAKACALLPAPRAPHGAPKRIAAPDRVPAGDALADWNLLPVRPDWAGGLRDGWTPGENGAHARLRDFTGDRIPGYGESRSFPGDENGTSRLSPHLHWGELSPNQVWHAAGRAAADAAAAAGRDRFRSEVLWHEFSAYVLHHDRNLPERPQRANFARLAWRRDPAALRRWQQGRTGIPIVDAGMRQLWQTGWMHNRARMITGSFLVKHLLIPWQDGERWFWDTLVDADLAVNALSWQWVAGCGTDSQPFFRIFNPVAQATRFDADGRYVRRWVPELARMPDRWLHQPWDAPDDVLSAAAVRLDDTYPRPAESLVLGRDRALQAFRGITTSRSGAEAA